LSVVIAFTVGAVVQYLSRLVFTFHVERKMKYFGAIFGGLALTCISYFILVKGLKGTPFYGDFKDIVESDTWMLIGGSFIFWTVFSQLFMMIFKKNILIIV